jgi:hypothetical protein
VKTPAQIFTVLNKYSRKVSLILRSERRRLPEL